MLIDAGADVNSIDFEGNSVLDFAFSFFNKTEFVNLLREHGAKTAEELEASPVFGGQIRQIKLLRIGPWNRSYSRLRFL